MTASDAIDYKERLEHEDARDCAMRLMYREIKHLRMGNEALRLNMTIAEQVIADQRNELKQLKHAFAYNNNNNNNDHENDGA